MTVLATIPTSSVTVPTVLRGASNGQLDASGLRSPDYHTSTVYQLFAPVSYAMEAMHAAAEREGVKLDTTGRYRSYSRQLSLFLERYSEEPIAGRPTKWWNGATWWQKSGVAMAATPGSSNHGLGLADDLAKDDNDDRTVESIGDAVLTWLRDNAVRFGFGLETRVEAWHWHWIGGDALSQDVVDELDHAGTAIPDLSAFGFTVPAPTPPPPPVDPTPPPTQEDHEMTPRIARSATNPYALRRGVPGVGADVLRSNEHNRLKAKLDAGEQVPYVSPVDGTPITAFDSAKPGGIPTLDETDVDLLVGYVTFDSTVGTVGGDEG